MIDEKKINKFNSIMLKVLIGIIIVGCGLVGYLFMHKQELIQKNFENDLDESLFKYSNNYQYTTFFDCKLVDDDGKLVRDNFIKVVMSGDENSNLNGIASLLQHLRKNYDLKNTEVEGIEFRLGKTTMYVTKDTIIKTEWTKIGNDDFFNKFEITTD